MIEVFKTNVEHPGQAEILVQKIQEELVGHTVNFDLGDRDRILRVKCNHGEIQTDELIRLLNESGYEAGVLPDDFIPGEN